jgi:hypothetical protein
MTLEELDAFRKDVKRLSKKYKSLPDDLLVLKKVLMVMQDERPPFSFEIEHPHEHAQIIKVCRIACKSLKGEGANSGLNLIYALYKKEQRIVLVGMYSRNARHSLENRILLRKF